MESCRNMKVTTGSGKDVKSTSQIKGEASKTAAQSAVNETVQYETSNPSPGKLGGKPSGD